MLRKLLLCIFIFSLSRGLSGEVLRYGLTFKSHDVNQDIRTSLNLTPAKPMSFPGGFSLEFDVKFNKLVQTYGYVCRVVSENMSLDVISNVNGLKLNCVLIKDDHALANVDFRIQPSRDIDDWSRVKLAFSRDSTQCFINDSLKTISYALPDLKDVRVVFGKGFSTDVPPVTLKDVVLRNAEGDTCYHWRLDKYAEGKVYDEISRKAAVVENGNWEIDRYIKWHKEYSIPVAERYAQLALDSAGRRLFIATTDSMACFDLDDYSFRKVKTQGGSPFAAGATSQMVYDRRKDQLISYDLLYKDFIYYDFGTEKWSGERQDQRFAPAHHHNRFIDEERDCLVTFGGYGYQFYKAWMTSHPLDNGDWVVKDLVDSIAPRYLSALGYLGEGRFLILGGYGSISGRQEEYPKHFYDLHELDSRKGTCRKLFDLDFPEKPVAFASSMVVDSGKLYALAYNNNRFHTQLNLCEVSLSDASVSLIADTIPYNFYDMESCCNLFLDRKKSLLYAILLQKSDAKGYSVDIYSLAYPPLQISDVMQENAALLRSWAWIGLSLAILLAGAGAIALVRRKKRRRHPAEAEESWGGAAEPLPHVELKPPVSTIKLLGGFQVFDKEGHDITDSFTSIVKQIFLFILLNTIRDGKKVTSDKLDETFWFGMSKSSASNNRSVNIRKLRLLLEKVGNVFVMNRKSYWFIEIGEGVTCDYREVMLLLKKEKEEKEMHVGLLNAILDIAQGGMLLPNVSNEWVDNYKSEYSNLLIEILQRSMLLPEVKQDLNLQVKIANTILLHDNLDEEAVQAKCKALFLLGQKGSSKLCYDKFVQDYRRILGSDPKLAYDELIRS